MQDNEIPRMSHSKCVPNRSMPTHPCFVVSLKECRSWIHYPDPRRSTPQPVSRKREKVLLATAMQQCRKGGGWMSAVNAQRALWVNCSVTKIQGLLAFSFPWHTALCTRWKVNH